MGKWNRFLQGVLRYAPIAVDFVEGQGNSGVAAAHHALHIVGQNIGLPDLESTDPVAADGLARGIQMVNDGVVLIQHSVGNYQHTANPSAARAATTRRRAATARKGVTRKAKARSGQRRGPKGQFQKKK